MQVLDTKNEELIKYLIHIGAKESDIISHLHMNGGTEEETLSLISTLVRRREIFRDDNGRFFLANDPMEFPEHLVANVMSRSVKMFRAQFA